MTPAAPANGPSPVARAAGAVEGAASAIEQVASGSLGLRGAWSTVANMTAVGLVCVMFVFLQRDAVQQAREDRQMFREVNSEQWKAIQANQQTLISLTKAIEELAVEVKTLSRDRRER